MCVSVGACAFSPSPPSDCVITAHMKQNYQIKKWYYFLVFCMTLAMDGHDISNNKLHCEGLPKENTMY